MSNGIYVVAHFHLRRMMSSDLLIYRATRKQVTIISTLKLLFVMLKTYLQVHFSFAITQYEENLCSILMLRDK